MPVFDAIVTELGAAKLADAWSQGLALDSIEQGSFTIGEGGWTLVDSVRTPNDPLDGKGLTTGVDCEENPGNYPADAQYFFGKAFAFVAPADPGNDVQVVPDVDGPYIECRCFLDYAEGNDTGSADYYEIGVLDSVGALLFYATFPKELKDNTRQIENFVRVRIKLAGV